MAVLSDKDPAERYVDVFRLSLYATVVQLVCRSCRQGLVRYPSRVKGRLHR
jgi:hypothetical protein